MKEKIIQYIIELVGNNFEKIKIQNQLQTLRSLQKKPGVRIEDPFLFGLDMKFSCKEKIKRLFIDYAVEFRNFCSINLYDEATLIIGSNVFFNNYCSISCLGHIEIGAGSIFGENVKMYDHNHIYGKDDEGNLIIHRDGFKIGSISIGKNCWIGSNVTILNNVEIGDNVIIGADCLIYKSIPSNSIVKTKSELLIEKR